MDRISAGMFVKLHSAGIFGELSLVGYTFSEFSITVKILYFTHKIL